ncbi:MAG: ATP-binding protein [Candidatus Dormibacteria bacterium]
MTQVTDLRLPADRDYVVVAKRTAGAIGAVSGFDVDAVDDLTIAVSQAFENAITCLESSGFLTGQVRIAFKRSKRGLEVTVRSSVSREVELAARAERDRVRAIELDREAAVQHVETAAATDLALRLMGLFVDRSTYQRNERTGGLRVVLTKYRDS